MLLDQEEEGLPLLEAPRAGRAAAARTTSRRLPTTTAAPPGCSSGTAAARPSCCRASSSPGASTTTSSSCAATTTSSRDCGGSATYAEAAAVPRRGRGLRPRPGLPGVHLHVRRAAAPVARDARQWAEADGRAPRSCSTVRATRDDRPRDAAVPRAAPGPSGPHRGRAPARRSAREHAPPRRRARVVGARPAGLHRARLAHRRPGRRGAVPRLLLERTDRPGCAVQRGELLRYLRRLGLRRRAFPAAPSGTPQGSRATGGPRPALAARSATPTSARWSCRSPASPSRRWRRSACSTRSAPSRRATSPAGGCATSASTGSPAGRRRAPAATRPG